MNSNDFKTNQRDIAFPYIDEKTDEMVIASLMIKLNAFVSIETVEKLTGLSRATQYRKRKNGDFPSLVRLSPNGNHKAYRIRDIQKWLKSQS